MSRVTTSEKNYWRDRISARLDRRIEVLYASRPAMKEELTRQARQLALESLGLSQLQHRLDELEKQQQALNRKQQKLQRLLLATVRGVEPEQLESRLTPSQSQQTALQVVMKRQQVHEAELLAADELGRQILQLQQEKDQLLDTVWLATSPTQLRDLWARVSALLEEALTPLQQETLNIPVSDDARD